MEEEEWGHPEKGAQTHILYSAGRSDYFLKKNNDFKQESRHTL
jgi:hypothetical protein